MIVYCATNNLNGKKYIGQTVRSLEERKQEHFYNAKKHNPGCVLFYKALRKYGDNGFKWDVIAKAKDREELNKLESYYIEKYDTTNPEKGYNLKGGGYNPFLTEVVKRKIGVAQLGELNHMYGKHGKDNHSSKKVYNVTDETYYESATDCALDLGLTVSKVCAVCSGERATTGNKVFRYVVDGEIEEVDCVRTRKSKQVKNLSTGVVYNSVVEASIQIYGDKKYATKIYNDIRRKKGKWAYV